MTEPRIEPVIQAKFTTPFSEAFPSGTVTKVREYASRAFNCYGCRFQEESGLSEAEYTRESEMRDEEMR